MIIVICMIKKMLGAFPRPIAVLMFVQGAHQLEWCLLLVKQNKQLKQKQKKQWFSDGFVCILHLLPSMRSYSVHPKLAYLILPLIGHYSSRIHTGTHLHITSPSYKWPSQATLKADSHQNHVYGVCALRCSTPSVPSHAKRVSERR